MAKVGLIKDTKISEKTPLVDVKFTHSLCIGQTGSGKTTSFIYPNLLERMNLGHGILFFDIKGNEHLSVKVLAKESGRLDDIIEIGKPWGRDLNIFENFSEREFSRLLETRVNTKNGGQNTYFHNAANTLGLELFNILKICSIIKQELDEINQNLYKHNQNFEFLKDNITLLDMYEATSSLKSLDEFLSNIDRFIDNAMSIVVNSGFEIYQKDKLIFKNLLVNIENLKNYIDKLKIYREDNWKKDDNSSSSEITYESVVNTLKDGLGFLSLVSSRYICEKIDPINIVEALQNNKIVVINVRVIPDIILEILLEVVFEELIDLNLIEESKKKPISIFIDEAQRLINKNIPLDVLRSSKVDVILAVQSELQLKSKFGNEYDWEQISINIAQKFAFKSTLGYSVTFFHDIGLFDAFIYTKEYEKKIYKAIPIFIKKEELENSELEYQHKTLKIDELNEKEYYIYDVGHFEREREIKVKNIDTNKIYDKKIFTEFENKIIEKYLSQFRGDLKVHFLKDLICEDLTLEELNILIDKLNIETLEDYKLSFKGLFKTKKLAKELRKECSIGEDGENEQYFLFKKSNGYLFYCDMKSYEQKKRYLSIFKDSPLDEDEDYVEDEDNFEF